MTPSVKTTRAIVVLYKPEPDDLANLHRIRPFFDELVVVDNSPSPISFNDGTVDASMPVLRNKNEGGIAGAFNCALRFFSNTPDLTFLLDQDSRITKHCVDRLVSVCSDMQDDAYIVGPAIYDVNLGNFSPVLNLSRWSYHVHELDPSDSKLNRAFSVISSGSVISRSAIQRLGGFDAGLVIDHVDTEYALRAAVKGVPVYVYPRAVLHHAIGQRSEHKILGLRFRPNNHAPFRRYYISRNGVLLSKRYLRSHPSFVTLNFARMAHEVLCVLLFERHRMRKLTAIGLGLVDGLLGRTGVFSDRWPRLSRNL